MLYASVSRSASRIPALRVGLSGEKLAQSFEAGMPYCRLPAWQGGEQPIIRIREEPAAPVFGLAGGCKTGGISRRNLRRGPKEGRLRGRRSPQYTFACRRIHVVAAIFRKPDARNGQRAAGRRSGTMIKSRLIRFRPGGSISGSIPISLGYRDLTRGKGIQFHAALSWPASQVRPIKSKERFVCFDLLRTLAHFEQHLA